jgi:hypothetical protein
MANYAVGAFSNQVLLLDRPQGAGVKRAKGPVRPYTERDASKHQANSNPGEIIQSPQDAQLEVIEKRRQEKRQSRDEVRPAQPARAISVGLTRLQSFGLVPFPKEAFQEEKESEKDISRD